MVALSQLCGAFHHHGRGRAVSFHQHPHHELILVTAGHLHTALAGVDHFGAAHSLHIVPAHVPHDQRCVQTGSTWRTTCVLWQGGPQPQVGTVMLTGDPLAQRWMHDLVDLHATGAPSAVTSGILHALLARVLPITDPPEPALPTPIVQACARLQQDLAASLSDETVAAAVGLSVSHLGALFRRHVGCGPLAYRQRLRLELATRLLADPYATVGAVAKRCGYQDATHFIRQFRSQHGCTPGQWRSPAHKP